MTPTTTRCVRAYAGPALAAALSLLAVAGARAQAPAPTEGATSSMTRAAGMALRDGALAPGMLTVRVVRGAFDRNAANETVQIEIAGRIDRAVTGADGRAQFAHLPIGATVQATAVVDGEALASERFEMAAESGIRVLLIAGEGSATASGIPVETAPPSATDAAPIAVTGAPAPAGAAREDPAVLGIRAAFALATAAALALVVFGRYGWRPGRPRRTPEA